MPLGIPHSVFLSWDPLDQDKALAWQRARLEVCDSCGTRSVEWERNPYAYVATTVRCRGCETMEQERDQLRQIEENGGGSTKGVTVRLVRPKEDER